MIQETKRPEDFLPLAPQAYAILVALAGMEMHGNEIMKHVEEELRQEIPTPTLYRYIRQLVDGGLIEVDEAKTSASDDARRRYYKLSSFGQRVLVEETQRLYKMTARVQGMFGGLRPAFQFWGVQ